MKTILKYTIPAILVGLFFASVSNAQVSPANFWKLISGVVQPIQSTWNIYAPANLRFDGEIQPDGSTCSAGQILKKTGSNDWDCAEDNSGGSGAVANGKPGFVTRYTGTSTISTGILLDNATIAGVNATSSTVSFTVQGTGTLNPFNVSSSSGTSYLTVVSNGLVGVNSSSPIGTLAVRGLSGTTAPLVIASSSGTILLQVNANGSTTVSSLGAGLVRSTSGGSLYTDSTTYLSSLNGQTGATQTFSTSTTATGLVLNITSATNAHNWALALSSGYNIPLTASTTNWNGVYDNVLSRLVVSTGTAGSNFHISTTTNSITINCPTASASVRGCLSTTDFLTFSNKQDALGGGVPGFVSTWSSTNNLTVGKLMDNGTVVGVNATSSTVNLTVRGSGTLNPFNVASSSGTSILYVTSGGNVGIGTTTPGAPLVVVGSTTLSSLTASNCDVKSTTAGSLYCGVDAGGSAVASGTAGSIQFSDGSSGFNGNDLFSFTNATRRLGINSSTPVANLSIVGVSGSNADTIRVASSSGRTYFSVAHNGVTSIGFDSGSSGAVIQTQTSGATHFRSQATPGTPDIAAFIDTDTGLSWDGGNGFIFNAGGAEIGRFDTTAFNVSGTYNITKASGTGKVGINTSSPITTFHLQGNGSTIPFRVSTSTGATLFEIGINGSTTISSLTASACDVKSTTGGSLYCGVDASGSSTGNAAWTIGVGLIYNATSTDSILIGTTTPTTAKLHIQGNGSKNALVIASSSGTTQLTIDTKGNITQNAPYSKFGDATPLFPLAGPGLELWCDDNSINGCLIGTGNRNAGTSAYTGIFLNNNIANAAVTNYAGMFLNSSTYTDTTFGNAIAGANQFVIQNTMGALTISSATSGTGEYISLLVGGNSTGSEAMRITENRLVGIGTSSPIATLAIRGTSTLGTTMPFVVASSSGASLFQITAAAQILNCATCRLTIPQGTAPTLSSIGDIGIDSSNGGMFSFYANGRENLNATSTKGAFIESPTASENLVLYHVNQPITITRVTCTILSTVSNAPSWTFSLPHDTTAAGAAANAMTTGQACTSTTTPQNITIGGDLTLAAGEVLRATSSAVSNASSTLIQVYFKYDN